MYNCPHCDEGPFSATDWWEHMNVHNAPWLQSRDPKDLERTDLGYGEDIQGMTTVPTHNLPNEPGFNPEKFGKVQKFVWADGKIAVTPDIQKDPNLMHHQNLVDELGYGDSYGPMAKSIVAGEYYGPGHMEIVYTRGSYPDRKELENLINTTEPIPMYKDSAHRIRREDVWEEYPNANDYIDVHRGSHPFIYNPEWDRLYMGKPGTGHMDLYTQHNDQRLYDQSNVWGRYFPKIDGGVDIFDPETNSDQEIQQAMNAVDSWEESKTKTAGILGPIPQAHRMVWLSQPNERSLKYWHHNPSNTTYAWDATGGSQTTKTHHLDAADDIAANHGGNHPLGSPDWEGGFYEQNEMGRHPADLWGLPSQVDYGSAQAGY